MVFEKAVLEVQEINIIDVVTTSSCDPYDGGCLGFIVDGLD